MTRVNLEDELFGERRLFTLAKKMGWDRRTALGALGMLWHDSQCLLRVDGSAEEVAEWAWCLDDDEARRLISALLSAKFISPLDNGHYLIHGNETQIENRIKKLGAGAKGGDATKAKWAARQAERQAAQPSRTRPDARPPARPDARADARPDALPDARADARPNAGQGNAGQGNAVEDSKESLSSVPRRPPVSPRSLMALWNDKRHPNMPAVDPAHFKPGTKRWRIAGARLHEHPDLAFWQGIVERLNASAFCRGEVEGKDGRKPWVANFDFLLRPDTHIKVTEGRYDGGAEAGKTWRDDPNAPEWDIVFGRTKK